MTTAVAVPARPDLAKVAAVAAVVSAVVHLLLVSSSSLGTVAMAGMALVCLPCAWHLWRSPTGAVWGLTATVDAGMLALHAPMVAIHHTHGTSAGLMWLGLGLVGAQLVLAGVAALRR
jgi:hypothetical protein